MLVAGFNAELAILKRSIPHFWIVLMSITPLALGLVPQLIQSLGAQQGTPAHAQTQAQTLNLLELVVDALSPDQKGGNGGLGALAGIWPIS